MGCSECLPTRLNPLAERTCFSQVPSFGLPGDPRKRWCGPCAKQHPTAVNHGAKRCEGDGCAKGPTYGLPDDLNAIRWCRAGLLTQRVLGVPQDAFAPLADLSDPLQIGTVP